MANLTADQRKAIIDGLTANCQCQGEDRASLEKLSDGVLSSLQKQQQTTNSNTQQTDSTVAPPAPVQQQQTTQQPAPVANEQMQQLATVVNQLTSPDFQSMLGMMSQQGAQVREKLVKKITSNNQNEFTDEQLAAMDLATLKNIAKMAGGSDAGNVLGAGDYGAAAGGVGFVGNANGGVTDPDVPTEGLAPTPVINFAESAGGEEAA